MISDADLGWAAGIVDGEGCFSIKRGSRGISISVSMTHQQTIQRFVDFFGGTCLVKKTTGKKPQWTWTLGSGPAYRAIQSILPHLFTKREEAGVCVEYWETTRDCRGLTRYPCTQGQYDSELVIREGLRERLSQLKKGVVTS